MKIIFLDVDGVLNNHHYWEELKINGEEIMEIYNDSSHTKLDPKNLTFLKKILKETEAKIVLSSTWRKNVKNMEYLKKQFQKNKISWDTVIDITPSLSQERGNEINKWLKETKNKVENFVILDDDSDMCNLIPNLVKTNFSYGLQQRHVDQAIKILNQKM